MRLHCIQRDDGTVGVLAERMRASLIPVMQGLVLGSADVDLANLSRALVLGIGRDAWVIAHGDDALLLQLSVATQRH